MPEWGNGGSPCILLEATWSIELPEAEREGLYHLATKLRQIGEAWQFGENIQVCPGCIHLVSIAFWEEQGLFVSLGLARLTFGIGPDVESFPDRIFDGSTADTAAEDAAVITLLHKDSTAPMQPRTPLGPDQVNVLLLQHSPFLREVLPRSKERGTP
jgi:hypothetical protein